MNTLKVIISAVLILCFSFAQSSDANQGMTANTQFSASYNIPSPSGVNMAVNIWGEVARPGQYLIPYSINMDIVALLSQAGGPKDTANLSKVILLREIPGQIETERVVVDITKFTKTGDRSLLPNLEPNDTIIINPKFWSRFQESTTWLDVIYRVAMIYFLVQR